MEKLVIQSNTTGLNTVERYLGILCEENNIANYFATISMPVLQAVENAIVHGNKSDETKTVMFECGYYRGGIYFSIEDQGDGFDVSQYGDIPMNGTRGEGIFLMKTLSDKMEYSKDGRCVRLEFAINGIDGAQALERTTALSHFFDYKRIEE